MLSSIASADRAKPAISLIVCTRNRANSLRMTLESAAIAAAHDGAPPFEVVVIDNGSTDNTQAVLGQWARGIAFDFQIIQERKLGLSAARNAAFRAARGDILAFTDDDCVLQPDFLVAVLRIYEAVQEALIVGGRVELGDPADLPLTIRPEREPAIFKGLEAGGFILGANMILNRQALDRIGDMDERFGAGTRLCSGEDTDYVWRAWTAGVPVHYRPELCVYHFHGRRSLEEASKLFHGYWVGNGALYVKHIRSALPRQFLWNVNSALKETFGGASFKPELGLTYKSMVWSNIIGIALYAFRRVMSRTVVSELKEASASEASSGNRR